MYDGNSLPCGLSLFLLYSKTKSIPLRYAFLAKPLADSHTDCLQSLAVIKDLLVIYIILHLSYICQRQIAQSLYCNIIVLIQILSLIFIAKHQTVQLVPVVLFVELLPEINALNPSTAISCATFSTNSKV